MGTRLPLLFAFTVLLTACGGGGGGNGGSNPAPHAVDRVALTASAPTTDIGSGSVVPFEFLVSNPSASAATNVTLTTTLGNGLSAGVMTCEAAGGATCPASGASVASLPANGSLRFRMNATLASGSSGPVTSTASVTADNDGVTSNNLVHLVVHAFTADVRISGTTAAIDSVAGSVIAYSMKVRNEGPDPARNIVLENAMSTGQALVSMTCSGNGVAACPASPGNLMDIATLPNGAELTFTVTAALDQDAIGFVSNTLHANSEGDPVSSNNVSTASSTVQIAATRLTPSFIVLKSDAGDLVGGGANYSFDGSTSSLHVTPSGSYVHIEISGGQSWTGEFALPGWMTQFTPGIFDNVVRYPAGVASAGGMNWSIDGRSCNALTGSMRIDNATYIAGELAVLDLRFEQHCEGAGPALRGQIHWVSGDLPPGPVNPPPASLWAPPPGTTPINGNYVYMESDAGDWVGDGQRHVYTQANSILTLQPNGNYLAVFVNGNEHWSGDFKGMASIENLQPGYYGNVGRYPFGNSLDASMAWTGEGHGCNDLAGWFVVDSVTYSGTALASIDLRFEQHCDGAGTAVRGKVHWTNGDTTQPAGPQAPPPGLWQPAPGETPATGNYVYLTSDPGADKLYGATLLYTQADSKFRLNSFGAQFNISIFSYESWDGYFIGMNSLQRLQVGYYGNLQRAGFHNPTAGGLDWGGGCNTLSGWFVIDSIAYTEGSISAIDLRFEQHCENEVPAIRGKIHWAPGDMTHPPGPVNPPPAGLWQPAPGKTPASGNYVYLESDPGDYVGGGHEYTLTQADSLMEWRLNGNGLRFFVHGDTDWFGEFTPMDFLTSLEPGFYINMLRSPFHNPVVGGLSWSGEGRGCNQLWGWLAVDSISYSNGAVASIDLRFEQYCEYGEPALRGKIHWRADDPTHPPGPVNPPPANLWTPPPGATPASGNYVYLESTPGDFILQGRTETYGSIDFSTTGATLNARIGSIWFGKFQGMSFLTQLQPGYYGDLNRYPIPNPVKGDVDWSGEGRGCNFDEGWFVVDSISYAEGALRSVDLRFEQVCEGYMPPLHGQIHWVAP